MRAATHSGKGQAVAGLTLDQVWLFAGVAFVALRALLTPIMPHDFWWHLATGRQIVVTGQIPTVDGFSFTRAGEPFYNQSWLAQVGMYGLFELGGPELLVLVQALVLAGAYGLLLRLAIRQSGSLRLSVGVLLLGTLPASFDNWLVRPQSYAIPLFIASLYVLTAWRDPRGARADDAGRLRAFWWPLLLLPAFGILWVNLHGSFVLGGALIALTFAGELLRRWLAARAERRSWATGPIGVAEDVLTRPPRPAYPPLWHLVVAGGLTGLSWLVNPGGLQVLDYVRKLTASSQVTQLVTEWAPPSVRDPNGAIFFLFIMVAIVVLAYGERKPDPTDMLLAGAFLWLALGAGRNNIWFVAVATPLLARQLAEWLPERGARKPYQGVPALNMALAGTIGLMLLVALPWIKPWLGLPPEVGAVVHPQTPVAAVAAVQADPRRPARLFHDMGYGSYLIWAAPEQKVWADPRIELYPFEQWLDYGRLGSAVEVESLLGKYAIDGLLLSNKEQAALVAWAQARPELWELRYSDAEASYFVRQ